MNRSRDQRPDHGSLTMKCRYWSGYAATCRTTHAKADIITMLNQCAIVADLLIAGAKRPSQIRTSANRL